MDDIYHDTFIHHDDVGVFACFAVAAAVCAATLVFVAFAFAPASNASTTIARLVLLPHLDRHFSTMRLGFLLDQRELDVFIFDVLYLCVCVLVTRLHL